MHFLKRMSVKIIFSDLEKSYGKFQDVATFIGRKDYKQVYLTKIE